MNKKLILLMLALPLILMLFLFTATSTVSLTVKVPVERIEISGEPIVYLDLDRGETYTVEYTVYPTNAANRDISFSTSQVGTDPLAELEFDMETGVVTPKTCGKARVTLTTIDGGFTDNFIVQVSSKSLQAIEASVADGILDIGATTSITTAFTPKNAPNKQLRYEVVEGVEIVSVNSQGVVTGLGVGEATIRVISRFNEEIYSEVKVEVTSSAAVQFVTHSVTNTMQQTGGSIPLYIEEGVDFTYELEVLDGAGNATDEAITYALDSENKVLNYTFREGFEGRVTLKLTVRVEGVAPFVDECTITRIRQIEASWVGARSIAIKVGTTQYVYLEVNPSDVEIGYEISYENDQGYISVEEDVENGQLIITAVRAAKDFGESYTNVVLKIWATNNPEQVITLTLTVNIYN